MEDLQNMELRVAALEKFLGIQSEDEGDLYNTVSTLNKNLKDLSDFTEKVDQKNDFNKITEIYRDIKPLLESPQTYKDQMLDMKGKVDFVEKTKDDIIEYHKLLEELKQLRDSLEFKPVFNANQKMKYLNKLNTDHLAQSTEIHSTRSEVTNLIENYNEIVEGISQKFASMN